MVVAWRADAGANAAAPLVVLFHGRGSNETDMIGLADRLPAGAAYAAVRALSARVAATPGSPIEVSAGRPPSR